MRLILDPGLSNLFSQWMVHVPRKGQITKNHQDLLEATEELELSLGWTKIIFIVFTTGTTLHWTATPTFLPHSFLQPHPLAHPLNSFLCQSYLFAFNFCPWVFTVLFLLLNSDAQNFTCLIFILIILHFVKLNQSFYPSQFVLISI